jgi:hypothetical protein
MARFFPLPILVLAASLTFGCDAGADSPSATVTATLAPTDGTVAPQNAGSTDPVQLKSNPDPITGVATLRAVRVGAHPEQGGWDRVVFEFADVRPEVQIRYVPEAIQCGSGMRTPIAGAAVLLVAFTPAQAHDDNGRATVPSLDIAGPGNVVMQVRSICDFEAHVDWAIGAKTRQPFKVTTLSNPTRVVIDVKQ